MNRDYLFRMKRESAGWEMAKCFLVALYIYWLATAQELRWLERLAVCKARRFQSQCCHCCVPTSSYSPMENPTNEKADLRNWIQRNLMAVLYLSAMDSGLDDRWNRVTAKSWTAVSKYVRVIEVLCGLVSRLSASIEGPNNCLQIYPISMAHFWCRGPVRPPETEHRFSLSWFMKIEMGERMTQTICEWWAAKDMITMQVPARFIRQGRWITDEIFSMFNWSPIQEHLLKEEPPRALSIRLSLHRPLYIRHIIQTTISHFQPPPGTASKTASKLASNYLIKLMW